MRSSNLVSFFLFALLNLEGSDFSDFDRFQTHVSKSQIEERLPYLIKDPSLQSYYSIDAESFTLYADQDQSIAEYTLQFGESFESVPLRVQKVAIDPGHFGGDLASLDGKHLEIYDEERGFIYLNEGDFTFQTALALKERLEEQGIQVLLTRDAIGKGALEEDFFSWCTRQNLSPNRENFARYNLEDLRKRAEIINAFEPDFTFVLHYNVYDWRGHKTTDENFTLAFVPGAFLEGELTKEENRYEFLRLLLSDDWNHSIQIASKVVHLIQEKLNVLIIDNTSIRRPYLRDASQHVEEGVYARNLLLTRLIHSPICYSESLVLNSKKEFERLLTGEREPEVAQVHADALINNF